MIVNYRRLTRDCIPEALAVMRRFYTEEGLEFRDERARGALEQMVGAEDQCGSCWFILADGRAVGYFVLTCCFSLEFGGRFALLDEFYVLAEWRGGGIGALALLRVEEEATRMGMASIRLEVDRGNGRLRAFYARSGFVSHDRDMMSKWLRTERR
jgi:GNAT superfamily N-acetyltransferase